MVENAFDSVFTFLIGKAFCNKATCAQLELLSECYMFLFVVKFILLKTLDCFEMLIEIKIYH